MTGKSNGPIQNAQAFEIRARAISVILKGLLPYFMVYWLSMQNPVITTETLRMMGLVFKQFSKL
jgi:hypothetical protein